MFTYLHLQLSVKKSLDAFQVLMLTLKRLKLNVSTTFLSYAFNGSIFIWMKPLVKWPEREQLVKTMPMQIRKHFDKKYVAVIACLEVFIHRPSNLIARAETWSSYTN